MSALPIINLLSKVQESFIADRKHNREAIMYATSLMLPCLLKLGNTNYVSLNERLLFVISAPTQFLRILQHSLNTTFYFWILSHAVCNVNKKAFQQNTYRPLADSEVQCIIGNGHMGPPM